jgi:hypothetical protein
MSPNVGDSSKLERRFRLRIDCGIENGIAQGEAAGYDVRTPIRTNGGEAPNPSST